MKVKELYSLLKEILDLPVKRIRLATNHEEGERIYTSFNRRHSRIKIIKHKTIGVALIDLEQFSDFEAFQKTVSGKNSAVYFSRRCTKLGYTCREFDPNALQEEILEIHSSAEERQGRTIDQSYKKRMNYPVNGFNTYLGIFKEEKLVAYCWIVRTGELLLLNRLMGHQDFMKDGIMYKVVMHAIELGFELKKKGSGYVMYDTYYGAGEGLKLFKRRLGFMPYRAKWLR